MNRAAALASSVTLAGIFAALPAAAQPQTPPEWKWITDAPAQLVTGEEVPENAWRFVAMPPGWHVTMGPGGILYHPAHTLDDRFAVEAEIFLFPGQSEEGYGPFVGGTALDSDARSYIAFLARADGAAGVFRLTGTRAEPLVPWTRHDAVVPGKPDGTAKNILRIEAERDRVAFLVNGTEVAALDREALPLAGHVGLRIGRGINVHTSNLDVTKRLAPTPPH